VLNSRRGGEDYLVGIHIFCGKSHIKNGRAAH
jgi:hypothetical protein